MNVIEYQKKMQPAPYRIPLQHRVINIGEKPVKSKPLQKNYCRGVRHLPLLIKPKDSKNRTVQYTSSLLQAMGSDI